MVVKSEIFCFSFQSLFVVTQNMLPSQNTKICVILVSCLGFQEATFSVKKIRITSQSQVQTFSLCASYKQRCQDHADPPLCWALARNCIDQQLTHFSWVRWRASIVTSDSLLIECCCQPSEIHPALL